MDEDANYLSCSARRSSNCRARAQIPRGFEQDELILTKEHSHPPDFFLEKKSKIWNVMKRFAIILPGNVAQVYNSVASLYPETEKLFPFKKVESSIRKFRKRHRWDLTTKRNINTRELIQTIKRKPNMPRYIVDGFVFHVNITKGNPPMIYLRCLEYKRLGCHARAVVPYDGSIKDIRVKKPHNHPPDFAAEEKIVFIRELKEVMLKNPNVPSRTVYATLAEMYPNAAREYHFEAIRHKMNRWKKLQDD